MLKDLPLAAPLQKENGRHMKAHKQSERKGFLDARLTKLGGPSLLPYPPGRVKTVIYIFGCVKMQVLENGEN